MNENSPRAMPPTNNAAPVHTSGLFVPLVGARSSCCCCCAAFAMLSCKSPANADVLTAKTTSAMTAVLRYVMRFSLFVSSGPPVGTVSDRADGDGLKTVPYHRIFAPSCIRRGEMYRVGTPNADEVPSDDPTDSY